MAPEQALGKPTDQRSDIFSLGIVLFEMATGQKPFAGDSNVSVLSAVLKDTPPLVTDLRPQLPRDLGRMVKRCAAKDPEERYQTAKDLRNDLKALKEDSDSGDLAKGSVSVSAPAIPTHTGVVAPVATRARRIWPWAAAAAALLTGGAFVAWSASAPAPPRVTATRQITTDGIRKGPPVTDGTRLYFDVGRLQGTNDRGSVLAQVAASGGETVELAPSSPTVILDIDQNGTELLITEDAGTGDNDLYVRPVLGGTSRRVGDIKTNSILVYGNCATWSSDKSQIVYTYGLEVRVARSDGSDSRTLLKAPGVPFAPRWSPDGARLRYSVRDEKTESLSLWEANADGTDAHALLPGWTGAPNPCCGVWTGDGRYYLFEDGNNIWARAEHGGLLRRRTPDSCAADVRTAAVFWRDAEPRRQAALRGWRPREGTADPLRRRAETIRSLSAGRVGRGRCRLWRRSVDRVHCVSGQHGLAEPDRRQRTRAAHVPPCGRPCRDGHLTAARSPSLP